MEITKEIIKDSQVLHEGTTCYIMQYNDAVTYKIYKGAIEYIAERGEYKLDENETQRRLNYLVSKRNDVTLTDLPSNVLTFNGKAVGVDITYYKNSMTLKDYLVENNTKENILFMKQQTLQIVNELITNGIVPTDPHLENFLICYNNDGSYKLNMIDTDDQYISVYPNNKKDIWYEAEVEACYRVIDLSFEKLMDNKKMS